MIRKLLLAVLVAGAVVFALWRFGLIDKRRLSDDAAELRNRAEKETKAATKAAREAVESHRP